MSGFIKTVFACLVAIVVASLLSFVLFFGAIGAISKMATSETKPYDSGTMLELKLNYQIAEDPTQNPLFQINPYTFEINESINISSLISSIAAATDDPNIAGIYLNLSAMSTSSLSQITEIRNAIKKFKTSGKPVIAYADYYTNATYFLASIADKIYLPELGNVEWKGMASQTIFFKGTLQKLGVEPEIVRHGKYKSAIESFTQDKMSPENRKQSEELVGSIWDYMVAEIADARQIDSDKLQSYASDLTIATSFDACEYKLIDSVKYEQEVEREIANTVETDELKTISEVDYIKSKSGSEPYSDNKVALIYAEGEIVSAASGSSSEVVGSDIIKKIERATNDSSVKSVVLRINSPGGSALVADNVWNAVKELHNKKPVVVSMGEMAASGGYYIAAPADIILAQPTTITGSIGVFGVMINAQKGLKEKLGVTIDGALTNPHADLGSIARPLSQPERAFVQKGVEQVYDTFIEKVAEGRNLSTERVNEIAQGRVWSGVDAKEVGLIDGFGGINEAIALAADRAGITSSYRVSVMKNELTGINLMLENLTGGVKVNFGSNNIFNSSISKEFETIKQRYTKNEGIVTLMPYTIYFE